MSFEISKPLVEVVADRLIEYILENELQAGQKLPNEFSLGEQLGVGRSTLREAVKMLAMRNILEVRQGSGTFVSDKNMGVSEDPLGFTFVKDKQKLVFDLLEIRINIEPRLAALAAQNATPEESAELMRLCDEVEKRIRTNESHVDQDVAFHNKIAEMSRNVVALNLMPIIQQAILLFINLTNSKLVEETIDTHRQLAKAIAKNDPIAATDAMLLHLIYNRNHFIKSESLD